VITIVEVEADDVDADAGAEVEVEEVGVLMGCASRPSRRAASIRGNG
jgi:hypothetical protein